MPKSIHRPEYEAVTRLLREARLQAGLTQVDLAEALQRSQSFVSDVELGGRRLDLLELRDICQALGTNFLEFVACVDREIRTANAGRRGKSNSQSTKSKRR